MPVTPEEKVKWFEERIQEVFPGEECFRCEVDDPEDATTHEDHFFDWVRQYRG